MKRASAPESVPVFKLYGEQRGWPTPDLLHCESIHQRSSLYAWHIRVHQHAELVQLLYVHKGQAEIEIEGERRAVNGPCIQVVPSLCVHGFRFSPGTQGYVLSLALPLLSRLEAQFGRQLDVLGQPVCVMVRRARRHIHTVFAALLEEYSHEKDAREMMLSSLLGALLVWLNRQGAPTAILEDKSARKRSVLRQFARLIESHYREHLSLAEYAQRLGVSTTYLNCLCREFHGTSALGVLHQRLLLEAKRSLQYTSMSITQVSDYLGFSDVTYFSRFFRKRGGMAPKEFKMKIE
ncbi:TPA: helix-turn-helix domain-containing protein [Kluyvera ascorbata]|uniref:Arabinose operon regulatory protein n=1 Tax=Kluyvera genomosp. 2 TaxID=2774054 RepID=A0A2T2Y463_9ENTR|nr:MULTISPECIES: helix-turn-helix domain-containing protein [Enterobacteriaceae]HAT3917980.1 helix-turn-helix domain-containing protein [Kluyvera ascorbata]PSR47333.1 AraC family transcriptional regulator [Kluyvera genomosp. 2]BBQ85635.1 AraC family transcriptional regulator [Klebsiella sp. WP3-W18-ESBL-02]BBR22631.1 AraC family transcriptional regulator [Klebsiella sp. WP3-S18-ESBL-05]HAT3942893.1 helix-turn-helix domain-containing protein [Kluyvera ascorbata]